MTGSNKITALSDKHLFRKAKHHVIAPIPEQHHIGNEITKRICPRQRFIPGQQKHRSDITLLLDDQVAAPEPKSPTDKPIRLFHRYVRWCDSIGRRDHQSRRLARRFLRLMRRGKV